MTMVAGILVQALLLALGVLLAIAMVVGLIAAIRPQLLERFESRSEQRFSMRRATRVLDVPRNVDRWFYRYHRIYGAAVVILAVALLSFLAFGQPELAWRGLFDRGGRIAGEILIDSARIVLWILGLFALAVGVVVFLRPSALKAFEAWSNRWLTTRRALRDVEVKEYRGPELWVRRHPRGWGLTVACLSALCLLALTLHAPAILRLAG